MDRDTIEDKDIESTIRDPSTGLYNFPYFLRQLRMVISCSRRHKFPLSAVMIGFKIYRELSHDPTPEDEQFALSKIGTLINKSIRWDSDLAGRVEKNKIGIALVHCKKEEIDIVINRVLNALKEDNLFLMEDGNTLSLTLNIGSSYLDLTHDALSLLKEAEENIHITEVI